MNIVKEKTYNLKEEINFISKEFNELNHDKYIETDLLNDLIMYSNKEKIENLIEGIYSFNDSLCKMGNFIITSFNKNLSNSLKRLNSNEVSMYDIINANLLLNVLNFDINNQNSLMDFYNTFLGKKESLEFIKSIKFRNKKFKRIYRYQ